MGKGALGKGLGKLREGKMKSKKLGKGLAALLESEVSDGVVDRRMNEKSKDAIYQDALERAWADGVITSDEDSILRGIRKKLEISKERHQALEDDVKSRVLARIMRDEGAKKKIERLSHIGESDILRKVIETEKEEAPEEEEPPDECPYCFFPNTAFKKMG